MAILYIQHQNIFSPIKACHYKDDNVTNEGGNCQISEHLDMTFQSYECKASRMGPHVVDMMIDANSYQKSFGKCQPSMTCNSLLMRTKFQLN